MALSWILLLLAGKESIKKYLPAALFMSGLVFLEGVLAEKIKWWTITTKIFPKGNGIIPFILGIFPSGSVWILKLFYGNFYLYLFMNLLIDSFFTYPFYALFKKLGVWKLIHLKQYQLSLLFFLKSLFMYAFQKYIGDRIYFAGKSQTS